MDDRIFNSRVHPVINSVDGRLNRGGEVNEVRETPGWERIRFQIDSVAIDTVDPEEIAIAFEMKETAMGKRGTGFVAARGRWIKNHGEKMITGHGGWRWI